ncbi:MAG: hypothetical protein KatS3mg033_0351 [Thermonema sp.]|uniref:hypothetical protein n=1 Tax=Thermonema sp. TaxID=2231181 RepID=UPI0021DF1B55|nr:hypothetical protein [Thermonema sp.]GIV38551.1 MAG: hypothetical protein KatS3mg033_0351 [Thermonema sp.]
MILGFTWLQLLYIYFVAPLYNYHIEEAKTAYAEKQYKQAAGASWEAYSLVNNPDTYIFTLLCHYQAKAWETIIQLPLPAMNQCSPKQRAYIHLIKGVASFEAGHSAQAIRHFKNSLIAYPLPDAAYNLELLLHRQKERAPIPSPSENQNKPNPKISNIQQILQSIQNNERYHLQRKKGRQQSRENIEW